MLFARAGAVITRPTATNAVIAANTNMDFGWFLIFHYLLVFERIIGRNTIWKSPVFPISNPDEHSEQNKKAFKDMKNIPEGFVVQISGQLDPRQVPFVFRIILFWH
jgi:hypothetical protein